LASSGTGFVVAVGLSVSVDGGRREGLVTGFVLVAVELRSRERAGSVRSPGSSGATAGSPDAGFAGSGSAGVGSGAGDALGAGSG
jgi:hypothetical protein